MLGNDSSAGFQLVGWFLNSMCCNIIELERKLLGDGPQINGGNDHIILLTSQNYPKEGLFSFYSFLTF